MILEVEHNPNCEGTFFIRFKEFGPRRRITHVKCYDRSPRGEWCLVTGWCDDPEHPLCPAYAQRVEDSGAGTAFIVFGGNWGIRLKLESETGDWNLHNDNQWGEGYLSLGDERDLRYE